MNERIGDWLQTYTDHQFWPLDPRPEEVFIEDIAGALSKICRYGGHCKRFYSVAEHSVLVSLNVPPEFALWGLLHDAAEAYIGDMVRPLKRDMPEFQAVEARLMAVITGVFGLPLSEPAIVKEIDDRLLMREKELLRGPAPAEWSVKIKPLNCPLHFWNYKQAERGFMRRFRELTK